MSDTIKLEEKGITPSGYFKYLRSIFQSNRDIQQDVTHRIRCGWQKRRAAIGILCDQGVSLKIKGKFYRMTIRPVPLYESKRWDCMKDHRRKMEVAEIQLL